MFRVYGEMIAASETRDDQATHLGYGDFAIRKDKRPTLRCSLIRSCDKRMRLLQEGWGGGVSSGVSVFPVLID